MPYRHARESNATLVLCSEDILVESSVDGQISECLRMTASYISLSNLAAEAHLVEPKVFVPAFLH